jgi:hypothetical protein
MSSAAEDRPGIDPAAIALADQGRAIARDKLDNLILGAAALLGQGRDPIDVWSRMAAMLENDFPPKVVALLAATAIMRTAEG